MSISRVLSNVIIKQFYVRNTGFFLLTIGLGFGFLKTPQHMDLASFLAMNPVYYLVPLGLWTLYAVKALGFITHVKKSPENVWLSHLDIINAGRRRLIVLGVTIGLLFPILGYSIFLMTIAVILSQWLSVATVLVGSILLLMTTCWITESRLIEIRDIKSTPGAFFKVRWLPNHEPFYFIKHLFSQRGLYLLGLKVFSIGILLGSIAIFKVESIDLRLIGLGVLLSTAINSPLALNQSEFFNSQLQIFRNLPARLSRRFATLVATNFFLLIPELAILFGNLIGQVELIQLLGFTLLYLGLMLFALSFFFLRQADMESFAKYVFFAAAALFFVILGYVPPIALGLLGIIVTGIFFSVPREEKGYFRS